MRLSNYGHQKLPNVGSGCGLLQLFSAYWLTYWLLFVMSVCDFVTFPCCILGQVWYLVVLFPDLCRLFYS